MSDGASLEFVELLEECRSRERAQTRYYRSLAAQAEADGDASTAERLNALHADEQHHLSRITARLLELGMQPRALPGGSAQGARLEGWEEVAREREAQEVSWYEDLIEGALDPDARQLFEEILESERRHRDVSWRQMDASMSIEGSHS